jgi:hypothetical protein
MVGPIPYSALQQLIDEGNPHGWHYYTKAHYLSEMSDSAIEVIAQFGNTRTSPTSIVIVFGLGGAISRVGENETAFSHRDVGFAMDFISIWQNPNDGDIHKNWSRAAWEALKPHASSGIYINFLNDEGEDRVKSAYNPDTYARLVALKNQYDPTNLFRLNANIRPSV